MPKLIDYGIKNELLIDSWKIDSLRLKLIYEVIKMDDDEKIDKFLGEFKSVEQLRSQCFNPPDTIQERLIAINELIEGFGVEAINCESHWDKYYGNAIGLYINLGDTYDLTVIWDTIEHRFEFNSWGDFYEQKEAELRNEADSEDF